MDENINFIVSEENLSEDIADITDIYKETPFKTLADAAAHANKQFGKHHHDFTYSATVYDQTTGHPIFELSDDTLEQCLTVLSRWPPLAYLLNCADILPVEVIYGSMAADTLPFPESFYFDLERNSYMVYFTCAIGKVRNLYAVNVSLDFKAIYFDRAELIRFWENELSRFYGDAPNIHIQDALMTCGADELQLLLNPPLDDKSLSRHEYCPSVLPLLDLNADFVMER